MQELFQCGHVGLGSTQEPLHTPCHRDGSTIGGGGRLALPRGQLASLARSPRVCAFCHDSELGGGRGKKRPGNESAASTWTPRWLTSLDISRQTSCTMGHFVSSPSSTTGRSAA